MGLAGRGLGVRGDQNEAQHVAGHPGDAGPRRHLRQPGADHPHRLGGELIADGAAQVVESVDAERRHIDLAAVGPGEGLHHPLERQAVGQAGVAVVQGEMGDPPLTVADRGRHGVEAAGQAADLVAGLDVDVGFLAALQAVDRFVQGADRPGYAAGQGP